MSKVKVRLFLGDKNFLVPIKSDKTLKDLRDQVEHRYKIVPSGFKLDDFHVHFDDDIEDIIDDPKTDRLEILIGGDGAAEAPPAGGVSLGQGDRESTVSKAEYDALQSKLENLETLVRRVSEQQLRGLDNAPAQQAVPRIVLSTPPASEIKPVAEESLGVHDQKNDEDEEEVWDDDADAEEEWHPHGKESSPKPKPVPVSKPSPKQDEDPFAEVERRMKEKQRKRKEREMAKRKPIPEPEEDTLTREVTDDAREEMKRKMRAKMENRLQNRTGPRLKLEPTKKKKQRRKSAPQKDIVSNAPPKLSLEPPDAQSRTTSDIDEDDDESPDPNNLSPRSKIRHKMANRLQDRKGPRMKLEPTEQALKRERSELKKKKEERKRQLTREAELSKRNTSRKNLNPLPVAKPAPSGAPMMSAKEKKRIGRMSLKIGDKLEISGHREGILKYMGMPEFSAGMMFGLELIGGALGENSGSIDGVQYFECKPNRGVFISSTAIRKKGRKAKPKEPKRAVYKRRIEKIFEEFNPNKKKSTETLLDKYEGREHDLYLNVCKKYYVSPASQYFDDTDKDKE